jgi:GT2 family glycosyltransferase
MHNIHPHPKFSIITVTYNAEKVLEDTIQSIVTQSYKNVEYIIAHWLSSTNTGSTYIPLSANPTKVYMMP